jgi:uncharacterized peroxidase-related enzyme
MRAIHDFDSVSSFVDSVSLSNPLITRHEDHAMSRITVQSIESAPPASRPYLEKAKVKNGFVPNLLGVLANAPTAIETYLTVTEINSRGSFTLAEREVVQITAAANHRCRFCVAGHTAIAYKQGHLPEDLVEGLRRQTVLPDARLEALAAFTRAIIGSKGAVSEAELAAFKAAGYGEQQVIEVILGVALATLCNFSNVLADTELNPELAAYRWQPEA